MLDLYDKPRFNDVINIFNYLDDLIFVQFFRGSNLIAWHRVTSGYLNIISDIELNAIVDLVFSEDEMIIISCIFDDYKAGDHHE